MVDHLRELRKGIHHSILLQRAYNKYGEENFEFIIMEEVTVLYHLVPREQTWKDFYKSYDPKYGYDICRYAGSRKGVKHSEEAKKRMSKSKKGKNHPFYGKNLSKEHIQNISLSKIGEKNPNYGKPHTDEFKRELSLRQRGKPRSEETRQRISLSSKGKHHSEESKRKMSLAKKGKTLSEEHRKKIGLGIAGKNHSEETRRKIGESHKGEKCYLYGKHLSEETKRKISESVKEAKRKAKSKRSLLLNRVDRYNAIRIGDEIIIGKEGKGELKGVLFLPYSPFCSNCRSNMQSNPKT